MRKFTRIQKRLLTTIVVLCILACAMFGLRQNSITNIGYSAWTYLIAATASSTVLATTITRIRY